MTAASEIDWNSYNGNGTLNGTTFMRAAGPPRKENEPAVIIECGWNSSTAEWTLTMPMIAHFARVYVYDRSGYGHSVRTPQSVPLSADVRAKELRNVLRRAKIAPPYVLLGHSYGGTIVRQYLLNQPDEVAGMVLVDTPPLWHHWPQVVGALLGSGTYNEMNGLEKTHGMTQDEWKEMLAEQVSDHHQQTADAEFTHIKEIGVKFWYDMQIGACEINSTALYLDPCMTRVSAEVKGKKPLGSKRLSVIHGGMGTDFQKLYDWSVKHQNGTEDEREQWRKIIADEHWDAVNKENMRQQLDLSSESRWVEATGVAEAQNLQFTKAGAELITKEVKWVLGLE